MAGTSDSGDRAARACVAPAASRNRHAILDVLKATLPEQGLVLEIASGTGQHVVHFAPALPGLSWQPSDPDVSMRRSIRAHISASGTTNIRDPIDLDASADPWPIASADAVVCINMIHIAPWSATEGLLRGAGRLLHPGSPLVLYGPFQCGGKHTAASNAIFDANLKRQNPEWGVRDLDDVTALAQRHGLAPGRTVEMPANNLTVIYVR